MYVFYVCFLFTHEHTINTDDYSGAVTNEPCPHLHLLRRACLYSSGFYPVLELIHIRTSPKDATHPRYYWVSINAMLTLNLYPLCPFASRAISLLAGLMYLVVGLI